MSIFQTWKAIQFYKGIKRNAKRIDRQQRRRWDDMTRFRPLTERQVAKYCKAYRAYQKEREAPNG